MKQIITLLTQLALFITHFIYTATHNGMYDTKIVTIQGVSRLYGITAGGDFLSLCDEKSSYKHVSDFGRLRSYDRLKFRIEGNDY